MENGLLCIWEHNGDDTLLYAADYPGAYARGASLREAEEKIKIEIPAFCRWAGMAEPEENEVVILQDAPCQLQIRDADSDVLFAGEKEMLTLGEYRRLKDLAASRARLLRDDENYRCVSLPGEIPFENYLRIDNTDLSPETAATKIREHFEL